MYVCTVSTARSQAEDTKLFHSTLSRGVAGNGGLWGPETQIGYEGPRSAMRGGPAAKPSELFHSSTIAGVLDGRNLAARLRPSVSCLGGGGVLEPMTNADCDCSGRLDGMRGENRSAGGGYAWEGREGAHGDEYGREGSHTLGCSVVRKSRALQAFRSQTGACATVVEVTVVDDGMAWPQSVTWFLCELM